MVGFNRVTWQKCWLKRELAVKQGKLVVMHGLLVVIRMKLVVLAVLSAVMHPYRRTDLRMPMI